MLRKVSILFLLPSLVQAAPLTWNEVRGLVQERSPSLASSERSLAANKAAVKASYGDFLPSVGVNASRQHTETTVSGLQTKNKALSLSATASLNLFSGFSTLASLQSAKAAANEAEADLALRSMDLRFELRNAFFSVYVQQERLALYERMVKREEQNEKLVGLKYESGTEAQWNVLTTRASLERARFNLFSAQTELSSAREQLARLLHLDQLPERPIEKPELGGIPAVEISQLLATHPLLLKNRFSAERLQRSVALARASQFPSLDLSYSRSRDHSEPAASARSRSDSNAVALTLGWNLFNGLSDLYRVQEANLRHEAALLNADATTRQLEADLRTTRASLELALRRLPVTRALVEASEARAKTVSAQYRAGLKTYLDWEQSESQLIEAEQSAITGLQEALRALATYEKTLGRTLSQT